MCSSDLATWIPDSTSKHIPDSGIHYMGRYQGKIKATLLAGYVYGDKNAKKAINLIRRGYMAGKMTGSPVFSINLTSLRIPTNPIICQLRKVKRSSNAL